MVGLVKVFGSKVAVDNLYLSIPTGSIYGVVGPNGAGKTTTLSMTTGLLTPDHGKAYVLGVDVWAQPRRAKGLLGVLPDGLRTFDRLSGAELLTYCGLLRGMEREQVLKRTQQLLLALGLADIEVLTTPQDSLAAAREQWDDANNCLTISPGTVVTYERNVATNTYLQSRGLEVLTVPGSELGRGRGGPRCMSCPTLRQPV